MIHQVFQHPIARAALAAGLLAVPVCRADEAADARADRRAETYLCRAMVAAQGYDPFMPWQKTRSADRLGYGAVVAPGRVLTTEHLVRNSTLIELQLPRSGRKIPAGVLAVDPQFNLALLNVPNNGLQGIEGALAVAGAAGRRQTVTILQLDSTQEIQSGKGEIIQVSNEKLPNAPYASLAFTLLTDLNVHGEGAPVIRNGKLVGLMMSYTQGTRTGKLVPYPVIRRFLDDAMDPPYVGAATAGFLWAPLVDPVKRAWLGVPDEGGGVQVLSCIPRSGAAAVLQSNDVILSLGGAKLDPLGYYQDADFGRLSLSYLIKGRRVPGEMLTAAIVRNGQRMNAPVTLSHLADEEALIPENAEGRRPPYLVTGGLFLRELTGRYIRSLGSRWDDILPASVVQTYLTRRTAPQEPGDRVVMLSGVLPHPVNVGYQHLGNRVVEKVNGREVRNMADVFRAVDTAGGLHRVSLRNFGVDLVLDRAVLPQADAEIAASYGIAEPRFEGEEADRNAP